MSSGFDWSRFKEKESTESPSSSFDWSRFKEKESAESEEGSFPDVKLPEGAKEALKNREPTPSIFSESVKKIQRAGEAVKEKPSLLLTELPTAGLKAIEAPAQIPHFIASLAEKVLGKPSAPPKFGDIRDKLPFPEKTKIPSEHYAEFARENLPDGLSQGAEDLADIESLILPFLKFPKKGLKFADIPEDFATRPKTPPPPPSPPPGSRTIPFGDESLIRGMQQAGPIETSIGPQKDIPFRPAGKWVVPEVEERIGNIFTSKDHKFPNTTSGGKAVSKQIQANDSAAWKDINSKYDKWRNLSEEIIAERPELITSIEDKLMDMKRIPSPSSTEKALIDSLTKMKKKWYKNGQYRPVSNQELIDQAKSLRKQQIEYDFSHGESGNIFLPTIQDIENSVQGAAKGNLKALKAGEAAKTSYKEWAETFNNDYIRPWRNKSNKDFSKLYKSSMDLDEYNMVKNALDKSPGGEKIAQSIKRDLVNTKLKSFSDKGFRGTEGVEEALSELDAVLTPQESSKLRLEILKENQRSNRIFLKQISDAAKDAEKAGNFPVSSKLKSAAKYLKTSAKITDAVVRPGYGTWSTLMKDENIGNLMNKMTGKKPPPEG